MNIVTDNSQVIADLIKERDELKAHCDYLANVLSDIEIDDDIPHYIQELCLKAMTKTPQQSLAEIKAQAIEEAVTYNQILYARINDYICLSPKLLKYADKLKEQSK